MASPLHNHRSYLAFLGHRLSGLLLALFLPAHFLLLGTALNDAAALDGALALTDSALFRIAEWGLVVLLSLHLGFGLRLLVLELTARPANTDNRAGWVVPALAFALLVGAAFVVMTLV